MPNIYARLKFPSATFRYELEELRHLEDTLLSLVNSYFFVGTQLIHEPQPRWTGGEEIPHNDAERHNKVSSTTLISQNWDCNNSHFPPSAPTRVRNMECPLKFSTGLMTVSHGIIAETAPLQTKVLGHRSLRQDLNVDEINSDRRELEDSCIHSARKA